MTTLKTLVDETTNIKNELKSCHSNLSTALTEKGVICETNDKMQSLIDKISNIELGVKFSSGKSKGTFNMNKSSSGYEQTSYTISINLDFKPSNLFVLIPTFTYANGEHKNITLHNSNITQVSYGNMNCAYLKLSSITKKSFVLTLDSSNSNLGVTDLTELRWYAFE